METIQGLPIDGYTQTVEYYSATKMSEVLAAATTACLYQHSAEGKKPSTKDYMNDSFHMKYPE